MTQSAELLAWLWDTHDGAYDPAHPVMLDDYKRAGAARFANIGHQLLLRAGWSPGEGLGESKQGRKQPVVPVIRKQVKKRKR